jgi:sec-independent protein translocase protein TatA
VHVVFAEILGPDLLIVFAIVAILFGGSQLPKLARGLGSASHEFRKGLDEGQGSPASHEVGAGVEGKGAPAPRADSPQPAEEGSQSMVGAGESQS